MQRIILDIAIEVGVCPKANTVFAEESSRAWIKIARPVEEQAGLLIEFASGVLKRVGESPDGCSRFPEAVICA